METAALAALTGQRAEILAIAEERRTEMLDRLTGEITAAAKDAPAELVAEMVALYTEVALRQAAAMWWIDNAFAHTLAQLVMRLFTTEDKVRFTAIRAAR